MTDDDTFEDIHPCDFAAKFQTHTMETPTYNGILRVDDKERKVWDEAIEKELKSLTELGSFEMIDNPRGSNVLQSTWAFRKNWYPDGALKKYKVRFCVRGDQQINGLDMFDTYAPVVSGITIRLLLVLSLILNLEPQQVDYTHTFCQAPLDQKNS